MIILYKLIDFIKVVRIKLFALNAELPFDGFGKELRFVGVCLGDFIVVAQCWIIVGKTKRKYIRAMQCAMGGCLQKATALHPNAIFFFFALLRQAPKLWPVLNCFSISCNPGAISLSHVAFHMESERHAVSSPQLKLPGPCRRTLILPYKKQTVLIFI